jgi:hypothetical protein
VIKVLLINLFLLACFGNSFAKPTLEGKLVAVNKKLTADPGQDPGQDPTPTPQDPGQGPTPTPQDPGQDPGQDDPGQEAFGF